MWGYGKLLDSYAALKRVSLFVTSIWILFVKVGMGLMMLYVRKRKLDVCFVSINMLS